MALQIGHESGHETANPWLAVVQSPDEKVSDVGHQGREQPETIGLCML